MRHTISVAICVIVSLVLAAIGTRYIYPHWIFATLHSLQLHAVVACVLAMLVALAVKRHFLIWLLFAATLIFTAHTVFMGFQYADKATEKDAGAPTLRLLSFNILNDNFENAENIVRTITSSGADVVNVMEAAPLRVYLDQLGKTYPYRIGCGVIIPFCDQLMLSKTPIENPVVKDLSQIFPSRFILGRVNVAGRTVNLVGIHTTKPYFDNFHSAELNRAAALMSETTGPLVISGDFNSTSLQPNMRRFLRATQLRTGGWEPATWPIEAGPFGLPIDHVFARAPLKIRSVTRIADAQGSNHFGLMAEIAITGQ